MKKIYTQWRILMKKRNIILFVILAGALGSLSSQIVMSSDSTDTQSELHDMQVVRPVPTVQVEIYQNIKQISFPGTVQAHSRVELAFNVDGQIVKSNLTEGAKFKKGEVLVQLDQRDFQHSYDAALANTSRLEKEFERVKKLHTQTVISQAEFDLAKSQNDVAQAELKIRKKAIEDTILLAPFDGVVAKRFAQKFQHIKAKDSVLSFKDISIIEVVIRVPERLVAATNSGLTKEFRVIFDADKNTSYQGELIEQSVQSDPVTRTYDSVIGVNPPDNLNIFPGMTATVHANISNEEDKQNSTQPIAADSLIVPVEAVLGVEGVSYCWVIPVRGGQPEKRKVEIGPLRDDGVIITQGITEGEHVAIAGLHALHEGLAVRPAKQNWEGLDG